MIVEGLGSVTFVNGLLRVQLTAINAEGKVYETGTLEIPASKTGEIIQGLATATQEIQNKINEVVEESKKEASSSNGKKDEKKSKTGSKNKKKN